MLTVRDAQMAMFRKACSPQWIDFVSEHLRTYFPSRVDGLPQDSLSSKIENALGAARELGLSSGPDLTRYVNLCGEYGWDFENAPGNEWMAAMLRDPAIATPSERLRRLTQECIRRSELDRHNAALASKPLAPPVQKPWYE